MSQINLEGFVSALIYSILIWDLLYKIKNLQFLNLSFPESSAVFKELNMWKHGFNIK